MHSIMAAPWSSRRSPPSRVTTMTSAIRSRPLRIGSSQCTGANRTAMSTRVPGARDFNAAVQLRLPAWAPLLDLSNINHGLLLPILPHCIDDYGRPLLGPAKKGREDRGVSAQRPRRYPGGRRGHVPILDAEPLRQSRLITAHLEPHTGYYPSSLGNAPYLAAFVPSSWMASSKARAGFALRLTSGPFARNRFGPRPT